MTANTKFCVKLDNSSIEIVGMLRIAYSKAARKSLQFFNGIKISKKDAGDDGR